jgi:hypothetical protein
MLYVVRRRGQGGSICEWTGCWRSTGSRNDEGRTSSKQVLGLDRRENDPIEWVESRFRVWSHKSTRLDMEAWGGGRVAAALAHCRPHDGTLNPPGLAGSRPGLGWHARLHAHCTVSSAPPGLELSPRVSQSVHCSAWNRNSNLSMKVVVADSGLVYRETTANIEYL